MAYTATWDNGNAQGRLDDGDHFVCLSDADELAERVNRRRLLVYQQSQDFSSAIYSGAPVENDLPANATAPPFTNFRTNITGTILEPTTGGLGGSPATPSDMDWLWPVAGADEGKIIVAGDSGVGAGEVGLLQKLNGTDHWTDSTLTAYETGVRAIHFNELRQAIEWIHRGRWELPIYFSAGIFSILPDAPWISEAIANNGSDELRSIGYALLTPADASGRGLVDVTVRSGSALTITASANCTVEAHHCLRPILWASDPPSWNEYQTTANNAWSTAGGVGAGDSTLIGSVALTAGVAGSVSNSALVSALQAMVDGAETNFLLRRSDTGGATIDISGKVSIEFDLDPEQ